MRRQALQPLLTLSSSTRAILFRPSALLQSRPRPSLFSAGHPRCQRRFYRPSPSPDPFPFGPSRTTRFLRSLGWAIVFSLGGVAAAVCYRAVAYDLQSKFKVDSDNDAKLAIEIMDQMNEHPSIQALTADPDYEEIWPLATTAEQTRAMQVSPDGKNIHHLVLTAFRGSRGVFPRAFYNRSHAILVMVVGFSYGTHGDFGMLHNGAVTTMVQEAMRLLAQDWFPLEVGYKLADLYLCFASPFPANAICCITVMPASTIKGLASTVQASRKLLPSPVGGAGVWPEWFDAEDWTERVNTFIATASMGEGHPVSGPQGVTVSGVGRFQVEESEDWPPPPPPPPAESFKLDHDGHLS